MNRDSTPTHDSCLCPEEKIRYGRHLVLPEVGKAGQEKLKASRVLVVGLGGLGSPIGLYLTAAGIGHIGIVDFDRVELSNLQRQVLYATTDVHRSKLTATEERLRSINPNVTLTCHEGPLIPENALPVLHPYDVVIDGTDSFGARYLINDTCVRLNKPFVYGSVYRFEGQVSVFQADKSPCYRCLFPAPPPPGSAPDPATDGLLNVLPGIIGTLQTAEALKLLLGTGTPLFGRLLNYDALEARFHEFKVPKDPACPSCGKNPSCPCLDENDASS